MKSSVLASIADHERFQNVILALIVLNALCMAIEATPELAQRYEQLLFWVFWISQLVFVAEIAVRIGAHHPNLRGFFANGWNTFDFVVVAASLVPATGSFVLVARILRLLRVLRLVSVSDTLRSLWQPPVQRLHALLLATALTLLWLYMFAIAGFHVAGADLSARFGTFLAALGSVVQLASFTDLALLQRTWTTAPVYLVLFYAAELGILLNLAVGLSGKSMRGGDRMSAQP